MLIERLGIFFTLCRVLSISSAIVTKFFEINKEVIYN